uniref:Coiled-coil domain containing 9 n=1 Tax=Fundulus heteroclitus TaxID=8078 RepID=A0A3Q2Q5V0_FUNHE
MEQNKHSLVVDLKSKEEKDAELDKRIEALRKKNEALVKRYQEIEEDKKKAEQEGIAVTTPRKPRTPEAETDRREADRRKTEKENFTVTVDLSKPAGDKRVVNDWKPSTPRGRKKSEEDDGPKGPSDGRSPPRRSGSGRVGRGGQRGGGGGGGGGGGRQERRDRERQNIEKMNEEMERIAEYERGQRPDGDKPLRNFLDDPRRSGPSADIDRKEGSRRHVRNWGGLDFENVKTGPELEREWTSRRPGPKGGSMDMTMSMTGRERAEYLRWKKEREQIDKERLARHRNATGQWRREWDAQKTDTIFKSISGPNRVISSNFASAFIDDSMHDNRWEGEREEEEEGKEKEDKTKREVKPTKKKTKKEEEEEKPKPEKNKNEAGDDDDEWEDASDEEEAGERGDSEPEPRGGERKGKDKNVPSMSAKQSLQTKSAGSPKEQRTPRPKIRIPPPAAVQESSDSGKPPSPYYPLEGHRPVSDWGEEMEMQSPRSSLGGESPLKPSSTESSPPQKKDQEEKDQEEKDQEEKDQEEKDESQAGAPSEPQQEEQTEATAQTSSGTDLYRLPFVNYEAL